MTRNKRTLCPLIIVGIVLLFMPGCSKKVSPGTTLVGEAIQEPAGTHGDRYTMIMHIDTYDEYGVSGTFHWPTLGDSRSRFRGTYDSNNNWEFVEYEIIQGNDIYVPVYYKAKLIDGVLIGTGRAEIDGEVGIMSYTLKIE